MPTLLNTQVKPSPSNNENKSNSINNTAMIACIHHCCILLQLNPLSAITHDKLCQNRAKAGHQSTDKQGGKEEGRCQLCRTGRQKESSLIHNQNYQDRKPTNCHMGTSNKITCSCEAEISIMSREFAKDHKLTTEKTQVSYIQNIAFPPTQPSLHHHHNNKLFQSTKQRWVIKPR